MTYATVDPTNGQFVKEFSDLASSDLEGVLDTAQNAYQAWRSTPLAERASVLEQVAAQFRENAAELAELMTLEMGKPIAQASAEVELSASIFSYYASAGPKLLADEVVDFAGTGSAVVRTVPIGPLLGLMPWNFPYYQVARFVAPNLLLGNTVVMKHAANCPQEALRFEEIVRLAGAPAGVLQNAFATHEQIAAMIADPRIQGVSLTGSESVGRTVGALAGQHLKKCVLELGGSDPFIVLPDADLDQAVQTAAFGRFLNAGQACTAAKRLIVHADIWDEFFSKFVDHAATFAMADPRATDTTLGPMSSIRARDDLAAQVQSLVEQGATVHLGAEVPERDGAWYPATVLTGVTPDMPEYYEELFGPVAVVQRAESIDDALSLANDSRFGLGSTVFTQDHAAANALADDLEVGMVGINTLVRTNPELPFGGIKASGIGRELGRYGLDEFANKKLIRTL